MNKLDPVFAQLTFDGQTEVLDTAVVEFGPADDERSTIQSAMTRDGFKQPTALDERLANSIQLGIGGTALLFAAILLRMARSRLTFLISLRRFTVAATVVALIAVILYPPWIIEARDSENPRTLFATARTYAWLFSSPSANWLDGISRVVTARIDFEHLLLAVSVLACALSVVLIVAPSRGGSSRQPD